MDTIKPRRVLLLARQPGMSLGVFRCLRAMGCEIHVLAGAAARQFRRSRYAAGYEDAAFDPVPPADLLAAAINAAAARAGAELVIPGDDQAARLLAVARPFLAIPCFPLPDAASVAQLDDRWAFFRLCRRLGLPAPRTQLIGSKAALDPDDVTREFDFPLVIKPIRRGKGVVIARSLGCIRTGIVDNPAYHHGPLIVQRHVAGIPLHLALLAVAGRAVAAAAYRSEGGAVVFVRHDDLLRQGAALVEALGYDGMLRIEARVDAKGRLAMIAAHPRLPGALAASLHCGLNFVASGVDAVTGGPPAAMLRLESGSHLPPVALLAAILRRPWRRELYRLIGQAAQHGVKDAAVAEGLGLVGGVDAQQRGCA